MKVQTFSGLTVALIFACIVLPTHAQGAAGGMGSAAEGAAKQAGQNADDGDHYEQLDEGESRPAAAPHL